MKKSTCSDAIQIQLRESAWSTGGFPCIWLVIQCKVRSFLIFFYIIDFGLVHLAILLDFLFICRETDNASAFNNTF